VDSTFNSIEWILEFLRVTDYEYPKEMTFNSIEWIRVL